MPHRSVILTVPRAGDPHCRVLSYSFVGSEKRREFVARALPGGRPVKLRRTSFHFLRTIQTTLMVRRRR